MAGIGLSLGLVVGAGLLACNVALRWPRDRGQALMDGANQPQAGHALLVRAPRRTSP